MAQSKKIPNSKAPKQGIPVNLRKPKRPRVPTKLKPKNQPANHL
jgi:hypothetical protein